MHRLFIEPDCIKGGEVKIVGAQVNYLKNVLRLSVGNNFTVFDGTGFEYLISIRSLTSRQVIGELVKKRRKMTESPLKIILGQALPKSSKMDFIIQKATELGVSGIVPMITERTVIRINGKKAFQKVERWQKIAAEAARQSGRTAIPKIGHVVSLNEFIISLGSQELGLIFWEEEKRNSLKKILRDHPNVSKIYMLIGPEGGFSSQEISMVLRNGYRPVSLGERILRTDTAGVVSLGIIQYELGDLN